MDFQGKVIEKRQVDPIANHAKNLREIRWNQANSSQSKATIIDIGEVNHSGKQQDDGIHVQREGKAASIRRIKTQNEINRVKTQQFIRIIVKNAANNNEEIGQVSIELDELIDTNLRDLAK